MLKAVACLGRDGLGGAGSPSSGMRCCGQEKDVCGDEAVAGKEAEGTGASRALLHVCAGY